MWSIFAARPFGNLSSRRITVFLLAILMALFTASTVFTVPTQAQEQTDVNVDLMATWAGDNLEYNGWSLIKSGPNGIVPNLDETVCEDKDNIYSSNINRSRSEPGLAIILVICLDDNAPPTNKNNPIPAQLLVYRADEGTTSASRFEPSQPSAINVAAMGTDGIGRNLENEESTPTTSCDSTFLHGIGWIVCPITNFLADGMDLLFDVLTSFLIVQPVSTDQSSVLYRAWGFMRSLANVLFVVGFLIIIYSQITSIGLSSHGVKRMLPRLVIAALLVNISYWIAGAAVDLSNILGFAFQQMFVSIRESLVIPGQTTTALDTWQVVNWKSVATFILSGGAVVGSLAIVGYTAAAFTLGGAIMLLVPTLMSVLLAVLVAILVLAARQALITVLIILSPLAFVAYLLPNTEKYFDRWKDLFITMLMVFPIFSVVFGGAQLAGLAIILSAPTDNANGIHVIILGMAVQVVPLAITPLLIKVSGNLLGRVAGMVNNPNRGLIDKTRNLMQERAEMRRLQQIGATDENGNLLHNGLGARVARNLEYRKRRRAGQQKAYENAVGANFKNTTEAHQIHAQDKIAHLIETRGESEAETIFNRQVQRTDALRRLDVESRVSQQEANLTKTENDNAFERVKADPTVDTALGSLGLRAQALTNAEKTQANRLNTAQRVQNSNYADEMLRNAALQAEAGDIRIDEYGAQRVKTAAQAQETSAYQERIKNYRTSFGYENISEEDALQLALGHDAGDYTVNPELREAAVEHVIDLGHVESFIRLQREIDLRAPADPTAPDPLRSLRQTYAAAMKSSPMKPKFIPTSALTDAIPQGLDAADPTNYGQQLINKWVRNAVMANKYDATGLNKTDPDDINHLTAVLSPHPVTGAPSPVLTELMATPEGRAALERQKQSIRRNFKDEQLFRDLGNRLAPIRQLGELLLMDPADLEP